MREDKHKCTWVENDGQKVLACKINGQGPVVAYPRDDGGYDFVPEGEINDENEAKAIKKMKVRLGTEGKSGEFA